MLRGLASSTRSDTGGFGQLFGHVGLFPAEAAFVAAEVTTGAGTFRADALAAKVPKRAWQKISAGRGAKGQRFYDWAVIDLADSGRIQVQ